MRALVCDCCGKVSILSSPFDIYLETNFHQIQHCGEPNDSIEICNECFEKLIAAVRKVEADNG